MFCCRRLYRCAAGVLDYADQLAIPELHLLQGLVSPTCLVHLAGFWRQSFRVKAEAMFNNQIAGLLTLAALTVVGAVAIMALKPVQTSPKVPTGDTKLANT